MDHHDKLFDMGLRENNRAHACLAKCETLKAEKKNLHRQHVGPSSADFIERRGRELDGEIDQTERQAAIHRRRFEFAHGLAYEKTPYFPAGVDETRDHEFMSENQALYSDLFKRGMTKSTGESLKGDGHIPERWAPSGHSLDGLV